METATLAGGCFWCTEAIFKRLRGVESVLPGYSGGQVDNPTYEQVCSGKTGHAEATEIKFDSKQITFEHILDIFFATIDPTTLNQQGADVGPQYRSAIFYHTDEQKKIAEDKIKELQELHKYNSPIVTEITPFKNFFVAEDYHKNYFDNNRNAGYCRIVIDPKIQKLIKDFSKDLK